MKDTDILKINRLQDIHRYKEYGDYKITILDFDMISSIKKWKIQMKRRIRELVSSALLDSETAEDAIQKIYEPFKVYLIEGYASVFTYLWQNNEYKSIVAWGDKELFVSREELFWLNYYPFLQITDSVRGLNCQFTIPIACSASNMRIDTKNILLSHNLHFGHFLIDDLATVRFHIESNPRKSQVTGLLQRMHKPIIDAASYLASPSGISINPILMQYTKDMSANELTKVKSSNLYQAKTLNSYHQCFLSRYILRSPNNRISTRQPLNKETKRVFLVRQGDYKSRIQNMTCIRSLLVSYGFILVNPATHTLKQLHDILFNAEIIISEGGSTGINASLLSSSHAKILLLLSKSMLVNTSESMRQSGIPYSLSFLDQIDFLTGESVQKHAIQSSDIINYNVDDIKAWLVKAIEEKGVFTQSLV